AQLQLRLEHQSEPRQSQCEEDSEKDERAVVHRATSAICGLTAATMAGTQQARQQRTSHTARFNASSALPHSINTSPKVLTRKNTRPMRSASRNGLLGSFNARPWKTPPSAREDT